MKCPDCGSELKKVEVAVHGASNKAVSYQCSKCSHFEFEPVSSKKVLDELGLKRYCCRSVFVGHIDLINDISKFRKD